MMVNTIIGLPVETRSGTPLGKIVGVDIDPVMHTVTQYHISSSTFVKKIITDTKDVLVHPTQVISLSSTRMIVVDSRANEPIDGFAMVEKQRMSLPLQNPQPMQTRSSQ